MCGYVRECVCGCVHVHVCKDVGVYMYMCAGPSQLSLRSVCVCIFHKPSTVSNGLGMRL